MSRIIDGAAPEVQDEFDRVWSQTTQNSTDMAEMQLRQARIEKLLLDARIERPTATRQIGNYMPDPVRQHAPSPDYRTERADDCGRPASDEPREKLARIESRLRDAGVPDSPRCTAEDTIISLLAEFGVVRPFAGKVVDSGHSYRVQLELARQQLDQVRAILADFLAPAGIPSPAQRIVLRIIEAVGLGGDR